MSKYDGAYDIRNCVVEEGSWCERTTLQHGELLTQEVSFFQDLVL